MTAPTPCVTSKAVPLLRLSPFPADSFYLGDAFEGVAIFGMSGSGKSSGSGQALAKAYLRAGFGGIVLCAKEDEADTWERYAAETGRSADIIRFDDSGRWKFNFLEYEMQRDDVKDDILTANLVATIKSVVEVADRATGLAAHGGGGDQFWEKSSRKYLLMAVDLLYAATGRVRLDELIDLINSAPENPDQLKNHEWCKGSFFMTIVQKMQARKDLISAHESKRLAQFWLKSFPSTTERTRSNIIVTLLTDLDLLARGTMHELFSTDTNVVPELTHDGAIILLDFPVKVWNESGVLAQLIFKLIWMKAAERRPQNNDTRPLFMWGDEAQLFTSDYDMKFQSTARSSRTSTVLLTQNLSGFYSSIGGSQPEHTVDAMLGNLRTKIFHRNDNKATNHFATELIGKETVWRQSFGQNSGWNQGQTSGWSQGQTETENQGANSGASRGMSYSTDGEGHGSSSINYSRTIGDSAGSSTSTNSGTSGGSSQGISGGRNFGLQEHREYAVEPHEFTIGPQSGGPQNSNVVTGVMVLPGRFFERNGKHWMLLAFDQGA